MEWNLMFFLESILLGVGLAMDAFSVSLANGMNEHGMKTPKMLGVAGVFSGFQFLMPLIGWVCVHTVLEYFDMLGKLIPWIALALLSFIGGKMILESVRECDCGDSDEGKDCVKKTGITALLVQGIATSIDALSVGFTVAEYDFLKALVSCLLIGAVTYGICLGGLMIGKKFGSHLSGKAGILGGVILIVIGIEIFLKGILGA